MSTVWTCMWSPFLFNNHKDKERDTNSSKFHFLPIQIQSCTVPAFPRVNIPWLFSFLSLSHSGPTLQLVGSCYITWVNLSDFIRLHLEPKNALSNFFWCVKSCASPCGIIAGVTDTEAILVTFLSAWLLSRTKPTVCVPTGPGPWSR